jgi:hypothetical protein
MSPSTFKRTVATTVAGVAIASTTIVPAAWAMPADPATDDIRTEAAQADPAPVDLRTEAAQADPAPVDLRTEAAQADMHASTVTKPQYLPARGTDVAAPDQQASPPGGTTVAEATPSGSGGFDIPSAAIGAATGGLIVMLAAGGLVWRRPLTGRHDAAGA